MCNSVDLHCERCCRGNWQVVAGVIAGSSSVPVPLETEPELQDVVAELASETVPP